MAKITYDNKVNLNIESTIANINKGRAEDWNEVKTVVNENDDLLDGKINYTDIIDNLNSTNSNKVLSANQGKILNDKIERNEIKTNKNFDIKLGTSTWFHDKIDGGESALNNIKTYFDSIIQCHNLTYNADSGEIESNDANIDLQISKINDYVNNGGKIDGVKFHLYNLLSLFTTYTSAVICDAYQTYILNFIDSLPYKNEITSVWIFNEGNSGGNSAFSSTYASDIISVINALKLRGYRVSIPMGGGYAINECDDSIISNLDFISANVYPKYRGGYNGEYSTIDEVSNRFNFEFEMFDKYLKEKEFVITEFGCSASWTSFNTPSDYYADGVGKPISLLIEGFYKSKMLTKTKKAYLWYFDHAMEYAPNTLLSIKNNTEVRYAK